MVSGGYKLTPRSEQKIFDDLAQLCAGPGYAHAVAYFCFRDQVVGYGEELKGENYAKLFSFDRLIRTEISTLIGLMLRAPRDLAAPKAEELQSYIERTEALLKELHEAMQQPFMAQFQAALADRDQGKLADPFSNAEANRQTPFRSVSRLPLAENKGDGRSRGEDASLNVNYGPAEICKGAVECSSKAPRKQTTKGRKTGPHPSST
jgi:hypothetical protein